MGEGKGQSQESGFIKYLLFDLKSKYNILLLEVIKLILIPMGMGRLENEEREKETRVNQWQEYPPFPILSCFHLIFPTLSLKSQPRPLEHRCSLMSNERRLHGLVRT